MMARTEELDEPRRLAGYELIARLAEGPMGAVYKAKSHGVEGFEKILVVKVVDPELAATSSFLNILIEEAKRGVNLSHANIAQVYDLGRGKSDDEFYIATEFVDGFDLRRARQLAQRADDDWTKALSIFVVSEIAKGLDYAHRRKDFNFNNLNIVHRRLRPSNVMLSFDGEVKITDFGISRAFEAVSDSRTEEVAKRHLYSAPEVVRDSEYTQKSDIFSLGMIFYELLHGDHPYQVGDTGKTVDLARAGKTPPVDDELGLPRSIQQLLESMLTADPAGRLSNAGTAYEELVGYLFSQNLQADNRVLGMLMDKLRRVKTEMDADSSVKELGTRTVDFEEIEGAFDKDESYTDSVDKPIDEEPETNSAILPAEKIQSAIGEQRGGELPEVLETLYQSVERDSGKALLVSGQLGRGDNYLADRLVDAIDWEDETTALGILTAEDDRYVPFGGLSNVIVHCFRYQQQSEGLPDYEAILDYLSCLDISDRAIRALGELWNRRSLPRVGYATKKGLLTDVIRAVIEDRASDAPVVLMIDRVERLDAVSLDVLREVIAAIGDLSALVVMTTNAPERMMELFDLGEPENLESIQMVGDAQPGPDEIEDLGETESNILKYLGAYDHPLSQSALKSLLAIDDESLKKGLDDLLEKKLVRVPTPGLFLAGIRNSSQWIRETFSNEQIQQTARTLANYFSSDREGFRPESSPLLTRLHALSGNRDYLFGRIERYGEWLEQMGWYDIALAYYEWCDEWLAKNRGTFQRRTQLLVRRTEMAIERSNVDTVRKSLEPLAAMTEIADNSWGRLRRRLFYGELAMKRDDLSEANRYFQVAERESDEHEHTDLLLRSHVARAGWALRVGLIRRAKLSVDRGAHLVDLHGYGVFSGIVCADLYFYSVIVSLRRRAFTEAEKALRKLRLLGDRTALAEIDGRVQIAELEFDYETRGNLNSDAVAETHSLLRGDKLSRLFGRLLELETREALDKQHFEELLQIWRVLLNYDGMVEESRFQTIRQRVWVAKVRIGELDHSKGIEKLKSSLKRATDRGVLSDQYRLNTYLAELQDDSRKYIRRARKLASKMGLRRQNISKASA